MFLKRSDSFDHISYHADADKRVRVSFKLLRRGFVSNEPFRFYPLSPLHRRVSTACSTCSRTTPATAGDNYPPFNIERRDEDAYRITLAVAGFRPEDLDITAQQNLLIVQGRKRDEAAEGEMLHVGIANRGFERRFELADYVRVDNADLADGLLVIDLVREVPEAMKPKKIAIGGQRV